MKYELKIVADTKEELIALLEGAPFMNVPKEADVPEVAQAEPVKTVPDELAKPAPVEVKPAPKVEEKTTISLEDVQRAFKQKATAGNRDHMREILAAYGANKVSALDPKDYEAVMQELALVEV